MPIMKSLVAPNGVTCSFHLLTGGEFNFKQGVAVVRVGSWPDEAAMLAGYGLAYSLAATIPIDQLHRPEAALIEAPGGPLQGGMIVPDSSDTIEAVRRRKIKQMAMARDSVIAGGLQWSGSAFDSDLQAQTRLNALRIKAGANPAMVVSWRLRDGGYRRLTAADALALWAALDAAITAAFTRFEAVETRIGRASTVDEVSAIQW